MYEPSSDVWLVFRRMATPYIRAHSPTVANVSVLKVAEVPTNCYEYSIPHFPPKF